MTQTDYTVLHPKTFDADSLARETFALDLLMGLSAERKFIPSRYFYDDEGSRLFSQIMDLPEYYPARCEREILQRHASEIADMLPDEPLNMVELGAGDGRKTRLLVEALRAAGRSFRYVPIDISEAAVRDLTADLRRDYPELRCKGIVAEYFDALRWLHREANERTLVLFLGSNIGNFDGPRQRVFLRTLWNALQNDDLLFLGFDLKKDIDVMLWAYNDSRGVTDRFNLNLLTRINRELGANFDLHRFQHYGTYNVFTGAMESYLVSTAQQTVHIAALSKDFAFRPYEPMHIEYSFKFLRNEAEALAQETGYTSLSTFSDVQHFFIDCLWRVTKP